MLDDIGSVDELIASHKPGYALDRRFYTDPEIYGLEIDRVVTRNWILAGHQSELPESGDFKVLNVANESAIIVRGSDGELKAFANVCRHRGSLICLEPAGSTTKFACPYHGWTYDIDANWKLAIENHQECYHCATAHPEYALMHTLMVDYRKRGPLQEHMLSKMEACGIQKIEIDKIDLNAPPGEMGYGYSRSALFEGYLSGSKGGKPVAPLLGDLKDYDGGGSDFVFGAFSFLLVYSDHAVAYVFTPTDRRNCRCDIYWMVRCDAQEGKDYDVDELTWLWDITTHADKKIIVDNWKGVQSRYYKPGPFSNMENAERMWTEWILQELQRA